MLTTDIYICIAYRAEGGLTKHLTRLRPFLSTASPAKRQISCSDTPTRQHQTYRGYHPTQKPTNSTDTIIRILNERGYLMFEFGACT